MKESTLKYYPIDYQAGDMGFVSKPHSHKHYEIFYFEKGNANHFIDFQEYPIVDNSFFLVSYNQVHVHHTTRLLVDINSSIGSSRLFSEFSQPLGDEDKQLLLDKYYFPYRLRVENAIAMTSKPVLHLSIHTFAPVLENTENKVDLAILVDPKREFEREISEKLMNDLKESLPAYRIEPNEPHPGTEDGFTTYLRTRFSDEEYARIEIEVNQKFANSMEIEKIVLAIRKALLSLNGVVDVAQ